MRILASALQVLKELAGGPVVESPPLENLLTDKEWFFEFKGLQGEERIIQGRAVTGDLDLQGDIIDYEAAKEAFARWAHYIGVREMHQPKAIGVLRRWWGEDSEKAIYTEIQLSRSRDGEDAWIKVKEGVLKGLSIRLRVEESDYDPARRARVIKKFFPIEISLVDVPANPNCRIVLAKAELESKGGVEGVAQDLPPAGREIQEVSETRPPEPAQGGIRAIPSEVVEEKALPEPPPESEEEKGLTQEEKERILEKLRAWGKRVGIPRKEDATRLTPPKGYPEDLNWYGDPANLKYPADKKHWRAAVSFYNAGKGREGYTPREWAILGRRLARLVSRSSGKKYVYHKGKLVPKEELEKILSLLQEVEKMDFQQMMGALKEMLERAAQSLPDNPDEASDMLSQALAALEVAADVGARMERKVEGETTSPTTAPTATTTATTATTPATPTMVTTPTIRTTEEKAMGGEVVTAPVITAPPVNRDFFAGRPVARALAEGDLLKAYQEAGGDLTKVYSEMDQAVKEILALLGITSRINIFSGGNQA